MIKKFNIEDFKKDCAEFELDADLLLEKMKNWDSKQWAFLSTSERLLTMSKI